MTLAELQRYAASDCILSPDTIRAVLGHLADMPAEQLFERVDQSYHPFDELMDVAGMSKDAAPSVAQLFSVLHEDTIHATTHSHICQLDYYASNLRQISLFSQLASMYLPAIRSRKGDAE